MRHLNYKKNIRNLLVAACLFVFIYETVFAIEKTVEDYIQAYQSAQTVDRKFETLQELGNFEIENRVGAINSAIGTVAAESRMDSAVSGKINNFASETRSSLVELKKEMNSTEDLTALKNLVPKIYWDHRTYWVTATKSYGLKSVGKSRYVLENDISPFVEDIIATESLLNEEGRETETLKEKVGEVQALIKDTAYHLEEAELDFDNMVPDRDATIANGYLASAREHLSTAQDRMKTLEFRLREVIKLSENLAKAT